MVRTSRKNTVETQLRHKTYRAADYTRLSVVKPGETNDSIQNQKDIIKDYLATRPDIVLTDLYSE